MWVEWCLSMHRPRVDAYDIRAEVEEDIQRRSTGVCRDNAAPCLRAAAAEPRVLDVAHLRACEVQPRAVRQGLTLVHFSAQPKPFWSPLHVSHGLIDWGKIMHPIYPTNVLRLC